MSHHLLSERAGTDVAMVTYLWCQTARKSAGKTNAVCGFDAPEYPAQPLYRSPLGVKGEPAH